MHHKCPHHDFPRAYAIIEDMTSNTYHYSSSDKHLIQKLIEVHQVEIGGKMEKKLDALTKKINSLIPVHSQLLPSILPLVRNVRPQATKGKIVGGSTPTSLGERLKSLIWLPLCPNESKAPFPLRQSLTQGKM
ncbi:hypothetical protein CR513_13265, partial [Mucuna pruriens]